MKPTKTEHDDPLDQVLEQYRVAPASPDLRARILASAQTRPQQSPRASAPFTELLRSIGGWPVAGPALAFSMLLGVSCDLLTYSATGNSIPATSTAESNTDSATIWELALLSSDTAETLELLP